MPNFDHVSVNTKGGHSKSGICEYEIDTTLHKNLFTFSDDVSKFIAQRLNYFFELLWTEKKLWSNSDKNSAKVVMLLLNRSAPIFQTILQCVQDKILSQPGSEFKVNLYHCLAKKKDTKFVWKSSDLMDITGGMENAVKDLQLEIAEYINEFHTQDESSVFECEIIIDVQDKILNSIK